MSRMEEYKTLLTELEDTPSTLEYTVTRAMARVKRNKRTRWFFTIPVSNLVVFFIAFVVMVNVSSTFALACERIPLLRELADAVTFSPSLSAAVENQYVQPIDMEQTQNDITMRVKYVIVDQKQLNIFYTLDSQVYSHMDVTPSIKAADGSSMGGYGISSGSFNEPNGELRHFTVDFTDRDMPGSLVLTCKIHDNGSYTAEASVPAGDAPVQMEDALISGPDENEPKFISTFSFKLAFDPSFTQQGKVFEVNQSFILDGQKLTATTVEVYPTHLRLNLKDDEGNTAWLKSLVYYLEDEKGKRFEQIRNGITATGSINSPMMSSYRLESTFFSNSKRLTIYITGATWLDKDMKRVRVDLAGRKADALPEGVTLEKAVRKGNSWLLTFAGQCREKDAAYQIFETNYYDEAGREYSYNSWSSGMTGYYDEEKQEYVETPDVFRVEFALKDYPYDVVYLSPAYSRVSTLEHPVVIGIK